ncbi:MAG: hypothetical protein MUF59_06750 [Candidatus Krumholzibacteria bacterium]|nr:hypothetical protein [Candidatus Krumholzibacteria bacterium]
MKDTGRAAMVPAVLALALALSSCNKVPITSIPLPEEKGVSAPGLTVSAAFLYDTAEIEHLFRSFLPEHGVVPVLVAVRNDGSELVTLFSKNSLGLREDFGGFSLSAGDSTLEPLHPLDVVAIARNEGRKRAYRKGSRTDIFAGAIMPPAGIYYAWKGIREYREFKPLVAASLFPALYNGLFEPLTLQPGEERSGYLYFNLDDEDSPYESIGEIVEREQKEETVFSHRLKEGFTPDQELVARPARAAAGPAGSYGSLSAAAKMPASEIFFLRETGSGGAGIDSPGGNFLAIFRDGGSESLVLGRMNGGSVEGDPVRIRKFSGESASIADAAAAGDGRIVCAVNFKRKSKVFLVAGGAAAIAGPGGGRGAEIGGGMTLEREIELPRSVRKVFATREGFFALTSDSFCRFVPFDEGKAGDYRKLGSDVRDAVLLPGGDLFVLDGPEGYIVGLGENDRWSMKGEPAPLPGDPVSAGILGEKLVMKIPGRNDFGDTLVVFDPGSMSEISRIGLRGRAPFVSARGERILAAVEEGTILDIRLGDDGTPRIHQSAWLPFDMIGLSGDGSGITAVSADGTPYHGPLEGAPPLALEDGAGTTRVPVTMSEPGWRKLKEKKPRNDR